MSRQRASGHRRGTPDGGVRSGPGQAIPGGVARYYRPMSEQTGKPAPDGPVRVDAPGFDTQHAHSARVYNYWLGGKDNFAADRDAAEQAIAANPGIVADVRANRAFLVRAVRCLAEEHGILQFLDIGTGLPTAGNTHEVAQAVTPEARIVYVDNDPVVLSHAKALLTSSPEGATAYLEA